MRLILRSTLWVLIPAALLWAGCNDSTGTNLEYTVSKSTTVITEPLTSEGYPDYLAALHDRLSAGVTPHSNAAVVYWRAIGVGRGEGRIDAAHFQLLGVKSPHSDAPRFIDLSSHLGERLEINSRDKLFEETVKREGKVLMQPWRAKDYPHVAGWLQRNEDSLELLIEGTKRPAYFSPLADRFNPKKPPALRNLRVPGLARYRDLAQTLLARAMLSLGNGDGDGAWKDLLACHRLARHIGKGASLSEALISVAIDAMAVQADLALLQHARPDAERVAAYLRDLNGLNTPPDMASHYDLTERFEFLDSVFEIIRGRLKPGQFRLSTVPKGKIQDLSLRSINWDAVMKIGNSWYDRAVKVMGIDGYANRSRAFDKLETELKNRRKRVADWARRYAISRRAAAGQREEFIALALCSLSISVAREAQKAEGRAVQRHRNLVVAFALQAFRSDHRRYPKTLDVLSPEYLKSVPIDFFSGKPLRYKLKNDGYLLYSVGENGRDDGGEWRLVEGGDDMIVRMPHIVD